MPAPAHSSLAILRAALALLGLCPARADTLWLEAEAGTVTPPMRVLEHPSASAGRYLKVETELPKVPPGSVELTFTIERGGDHHIWGRTHAPSSSNDSFDVYLDDSPPQRKWPLPLVNNWQWSRISGDTKPRVFGLAPGTHTLRIVRNEWGASLDRILITDDFTLVPSGLGVSPPATSPAPSPAPAPSPVPPAEHRPGPSLQLRTPGHSHVAWPGQTRLPLPASATDPEPGPSPLITAWRVLDGPSPVELVDTPTGPEAVFSGPGLHRLAFSATDGAETAQEIIEIIVAPDAFIPPAASGVVNVKDAPYLAVGDGRTDDTAALQRALDAYPNGNRIIYLPPGDYLISDTLRWPLGRSGGEREKRTILQGASRELSRLILADHSPAYADPAAPRAMVHTGLAPAQRFRNAVRNLTLHTGRGNPGAIGLQFNASNQGGLRDVAILSGDGLGLIGLDLSYTDEIGPLYVKNLLVRGFDYGVKTAYTVNSLTFEHLVLEQQRVAGFHNTHQVVTVRELHSRNRVPAIHNAGSTGVFTLLDSLLEAPSPDAPAIINEGFLYVLRSRTHGHGAALDQRTATPLTLPDGALAEFSSHPSLDRFPPRRPADARLPVHSAPTPPWPSRSEWTSLSDHATPEAFDLGALQAALDSGARAIAVPGGVAYTLEGRATIPPRVTRITGFEGSFRGQLELVVAPLPPGASPTPLIIERLRAGAGHSVRILHRSERPVLVSSCEGVLVVGQGPGEFFVEDLSSASADFEYPGQPVFLRQYNPETQERVKIRNHGAHLWILGLKTERGHTVIETTRGGITELYGAHVYATSKPKTHPMFTVDSPSSLFLAGVGETAFSQGGHPYHELVAETRGQDTRLLRREDAPRRGQASVILRYDGRP